MEAFARHRRDEGDGEESEKTLRYRLKAVRKTLGDASDPLGLTREDAAAHVAARQALERSPVTIGAELDAVTELQRWAVSNGWIKTATWADAPRPDTSTVPPREHLLPSEVGPFLRAAIGLGARDSEDWTAPAWSTWPAAAVLLVHGARTGELRRLRTSHFDFGHQDIVIAYVRSTAAGRAKSATSQRPIIIASAVGCAVLRAAFAGQPDAVCFSSIRHPGRELPRGTHWFIDRVEDTCAQAGLRRVATHGLRAAVRAGRIPEAVVMKLRLGHGMRYAELFALAKERCPQIDEATFDALMDEEEST